MNYDLTAVKKTYKYLIILNVLLISFIIYQIFYSEHYWEGIEEKKFVIEPGQSLDEIITGLSKNDIIPNSLLFKIAVKLSGKEGSIISKSYLFKNGMNTLQLLSMLTDRNLTQFTKITIPEGYSIKRIGNLIEKKLSLSKEKFYREASNDSLINLLGLKGKIKNLEGFLYPDTYEIPVLTSERKLVFILFNEFRKKILNDSEFESELEKTDSTLLRIITLASIVQGETNITDEMPVVAGVYSNRLQKGMKLEADPTVQFIIPDGPRRLLYGDLKINSKYNTYLYKGLPPGPINNPGINAIRAALDPAEHNYIFFVATGEGGHRFTETYEQHLEAVKDYRKKLKNSKKPE
ncbi:MAG TPA: endolytic transglycosylase MltG [Ignavibacteria bacterium]|nr:endolytic transglycosylase MltG [Ignavibacteria bacterium]